MLGYKGIIQKKPKAPVFRATNYSVFKPAGSSTDPPDAEAQDLARDNVIRAKLAAREESGTSSPAPHITDRVATRVI